MHYDEVFINYCKEMMTKKEFEIYMAFIGADEEDITNSLLKEDFEEYTPPARRLKGESKIQ